jgi:hypothetical protein
MGFNLNFSHNATRATFRSAAGRMLGRSDAYPAHVKMARTLHTIWRSWSLITNKEG